jgi:hypothetical protein
MAAVKSTFNYSTSTKTKDFHLNTYLASVELKIRKCLDSFENQHVKYMSENRFPYGDTEEEKGELTSKTLYVSYNYTVDREDALSEEELYVVKLMFVNCEQTYAEVLADVDILRKKHIENDKDKETYSLCFMYGGFY